MKEQQARQLCRMIAAARKKKGLSLRDVDAITGYSYRWLLKVERGEFAKPSPHRLARVEEALDMRPEEVDRVSNDHISDRLPSMKLYFRHKFQLTPAQIAEVERVIARIQEERTWERQQP